MGFYSRHGGVWKDGVPYARHGGVWKPVQQLYARHEGVWKGALVTEVFPIVAATNTSSESSLTTSHTVALPSGISSGDLLLVFFRTGGSIVSINTPDGWSVTHSAGNHSRIFHRIADGGEGSTVTVTTSATRRSAHISCRILTFQGAPEVAGADSLDPPNLTPSWGSASTLWMTLASTRRTDNTLSAPSPYTDQINVVSVPNDSGTGEVRMALAFRELSAASENPNAWGSTGTIDTAHAVTLAVRPA